MQELMDEAMGCSFVLKLMMMWNALQGSLLPVCCFLVFTWCVAVLETSIFIDKIIKLPFLFYLVTVFLVLLGLSTKPPVRG